MTRPRPGSGDPRSSSGRSTSPSPPLAAAAAAAGPSGRPSRARAGALVRAPPAALGVAHCPIAEPLGIHVARPRRPSQRVPPSDAFAVRRRQHRSASPRSRPGRPRGTARSASAGVGASAPSCATRRRAGPPRGRPIHRRRRQAARERGFGGRLAGPRRARDRHRARIRPAARSARPRVRCRPTPPEARRRARGIEPALDDLLEQALELRVLAQLVLQAPAHSRGGDREHLVAQVAPPALRQLPAARMCSRCSCRRLHELRDALAARRLGLDDRDPPALAHLLRRAVEVGQREHAADLADHRVGEGMVGLVDRRSRPGSPSRRP